MRYSNRRRRRGFKRKNQEAQHAQVVTCAATLLQLSTILFEISLCDGHCLTTSCLVDPLRSFWHTLFAYGTDSNLITVIGFDRATFEDLLKAFSRFYTGKEEAFLIRWVAGGGGGATLSGQGGAREGARRQSRIHARRAGKNGDVGSLREHAPLRGTGCVEQQVDVRKLADSGPALQWGEQEDRNEHIFVALAFHQQNRPALEWDSLEGMLPPTLRDSRRLLDHLDLLQNEAPAAYAFWTKYFGDSTLVTKRLFRVALSQSGISHDIRIDTPRTDGITSAIFRKLVLGDGPLADMFGIASESRPIMLDKESRTNDSESGQRTVSNVKRLPIPRGLKDNFILLRIQAPGAYAFWTKYFGESREVPKSLFRAALARSGRQYNVPIKEQSMNVKVFRTLVLGSGPLAEMFASAPESRATEDHKSGRLDIAKNDEQITNDSPPFARLLTSPDPAQIGIAVDSDPSCGILQVGSKLVIRSPYSAINPKLRIETLQLLRTECPLAYKFWTVNFGARETNAANFRATLGRTDRNITLTVPSIVSPVWFRETVRNDGPLAKIFSAIGPSGCPVGKEHSNDGSVPERKISPVMLTFRDDLEILRIENPAAHSFWISNFQYAARISRTHFRDALRLDGIQVDARFLVGDKKGQPVNLPAFRLMIAPGGPLSAAFPSAEPLQPEFLTLDRSSSSDRNAPLSQETSRDARTTKGGLQGSSLHSVHLIAIPGFASNLMSHLHCILVPDSGCACAPGECKPSLEVESGIPLEAGKPQHPVLRTSTRAFGLGWVATALKSISLAAQAGWHIFPKMSIKIFKGDEQNLKAASEPTSSADTQKPTSSVDALIPTTPLSSVGAPLPTYTNSSADPPLPISPTSTLSPSLPSSPTSPLDPSLPTTTSSAMDAEPPLEKSTSSRDLLTPPNPSSSMDAEPPLSKSTSYRDVPMPTMPTSSVEASLRKPISCVEVSHLKPVNPPLPTKPTSSVDAPPLAKPTRSVDAPLPRKPKSSVKAPTFSFLSLKRMSRQSTPRLPSRGS
ncbi:hypothetical protein BDK51DRAFT_41593 [Blyttiomyces helicus]|uniref:Uncharacterized protein n=1 Tax=Blyttiomyces helicus TaxID=388810 RepID=A0A4P9W9A2_9FUNG|nr:hypothetical protein BDK51DRAFT_41593 [Blyttiomyces helicus]|eukprot:RKO89131.1 hypothetical protein BDK51DRAFT_41593 [Blyttiomyces helicus]